MYGKIKSLSDKQIFLCSGYLLKVMRNSTRRKKTGR